MGFIKRRVIFRASGCPPTKSIVHLIQAKNNYTNRIRKLRTYKGKKFREKENSAGGHKREKSIKVTVLMKLI